MKGKAGPKPDNLDEPIADQAPLEPQEDLHVADENPPEPQWYVCDDCDFFGDEQSLMDHSVAMNHSYSKADDTDGEPEQPALFETEGIVRRQVSFQVGEAWLNECRLNMERVVRSILSIEDEKKEFDADCNERLKPLKEQLRGLNSELQRTTEQRLVDCEWKVSTEQNARVLVRLDTGETIETKPLTEEDRLQELARVVTENQEAAAKAEEPEAISASRE